jgi:hypothetical protein
MPKIRGREQWFYARGIARPDGPFCGPTERWRIDVTSGPGADG